MIFRGLEGEVAGRYQAGGVDAYGNLPERSVSDGPGNPCRHCLRTVPEGEEMLILAHRPFGTLQPYAETGPIFLCVGHCDGAGDQEGLPEVLTLSPQYLIKAYSVDERIIYGTGDVVAQAVLAEEVAQRLARADVAFVDVRSARNNCWLARATRD